MNHQFECHSGAHVPRRDFLLAGGGALGLSGFGGMLRAESQKQLQSEQKRVVFFYLGGGVSPFESWDPQPQTRYGGPFFSIPTSVPGVHISELLPETAKQMHHLALLRSLNTKINNHGLARYKMTTGHAPQQGFDFPTMGSAFSATLAPQDNPVPGYVSLGGTKPSEAAFLGAQHAPVRVGAKGMSGLSLPRGMTEDRDTRRRELRRSFSEQFTQGRASLRPERYEGSYAQASRLMQQRELFDFEITDEEKERYGNSRFGTNCIVARELIERGITFVYGQKGGYDTHGANFHFHIKLNGGFDKPFATFIADLADRGLLEHTMVIVMSEFGRTPKINGRMGRDHWGKSWSLCLAGAGFPGGAVVGATNALGTEVSDREVDAGHLYHTLYRRVGLDPTIDFYDGDRPIPKVAPDTGPIEELLV